MKDSKNKANFKLAAIWKVPRAEKLRGNTRKGKNITFSAFYFRDEGEGNFTFPTNRNLKYTKWKFYYFRIH